MADQGRSKGQKRKPTRARPGEGSWRKLPNGTWRYHVPVGTAADGTAIAKDFYGRTKDEALAKHQAYLKANPNGPPRAEATQLLVDFLAIWLEIIEATVAVSTFESYAQTVELHIVPTLGRTRLCDLTRIQVQTWVNELAKKPARGKEGGPTLGRTVHIAHGVLRAALNYAIDLEILEKNVAERVRLPDYKKRKAKAMTLAQAQALIAAAGGRLDLRKPIRRKNGRMMTPIKVDTRFETLYLLYLAVGTRRGEPLATRWSDFDLDAGTWDISRSLDKERRERGTKTEDSERLIDLDELLVDALREHRKRMQAEEHQEGWKPDGLVFPSSTGTPMLPRNLHRHYKTVLAAAGLSTDFTLHDLRHTAGSLMLADGRPITDVSKVLGHSSPIITGKVYAHGYREGKKKAVAGLSRKLKLTQDHNI